MTPTRDTIREEVLHYFRGNPGPVHLVSLAQRLRESKPNLESVRDADFRNVVLPMIVTGKLQYTPELKIRRAKAR
jgi:hypothetical protein